MQGPARDLADARLRTRAASREARTNRRRDRSVLPTRSTRTNFKIAVEDLAIARALCRGSTLGNFADREYLVVCTVERRKHQTNRSLSITMAGETQGPDLHRNVRTGARLHVRTLCPHSRLAAANGGVA